ncbi:glucan endo-1 3-beta-glucosidas [Striga asiatica]|uniref:Glucan endo-1 3-beta-glucosidas n=1 Tax=Striga asiatica TaxID=4170 RepID=A0A5A7NZX9_STRAF|nr:glucan endo-1 3-beta-glucosidas [Striga asiatica]
MANSSLSSAVLMKLIALLLLCIDPTDAQVGVVFGTKTRKLPHAKEIVALCNKHNIKRMRIYEPNHEIQEALKGSNISLILGVPNKDIPTIASNWSFAQLWVEKNIVSFNDVNFRYIAVGNNISPLDKATEKYGPHVVPAMQSLENALTVARFSKKVKAKVNVSTAISPDLLIPFRTPSGSVFAREVRAHIHPILDFLGKYGYPLLANLHVYLPYVKNPKNTSLDYALFTSKRAVIKDAFHDYDNLFDVLVDAMYYSVEKYGVSNVEIVVSETGWPTRGGLEAQLKNARIYNGNLIRHVKGGSPFKPDRPVETYVVGLFDEDLREPGYEYDKHWGIFNDKRQLKYPVVFE